MMLHIPVIKLHIRVSMHDIPVMKLHL
jgi:hypothetical protein